MWRYHGNSWCSLSVYLTDSPTERLRTWDRARQTHTHKAFHSLRCDGQSQFTSTLMSFVNLPEGAEFNLDWCRTAVATEETGTWLPQVARNDSCTSESWKKKKGKD